MLLRFKILLISCPFDFEQGFQKTGQQTTNARKMVQADEERAIAVSWARGTNISLCFFVMVTRWIKTNKKYVE